MPTQKQKKLLQELAQAEVEVSAAKDRLASALGSFGEAETALRDITFIREQFPTWMKEVPDSKPGDRLSGVIPRSSQDSILDRFETGVLDSIPPSAIYTLIVRFREDPSPLKTDDSFKEYLQACGKEMMEAWVATLDNQFKRRVKSRKEGPPLCGETEEKD